MKSRVRVALIGARGRMGQTIVELAKADQKIDIVAFQPRTIQADAHSIGIGRDEKFLAGENIQGRRSRPNSVWAESPTSGCSAMTLMDMVGLL